MSQVLSDTTSIQQGIFRQITLDALRILPEISREAVFAASISRHFGSQILQVLLSLDENRVADVYEQLKLLPFVQPYGQNEHTIFPFVRNIVLQQWIGNQLKYKEYNQRLVSYYQNLCGPGENWPIGERLEIIYHQIAVDENDGFLAFEREFLRAIEFAQLDHCTYLLRIINEKRSELKSSNQLWLDFYEGVLAERFEKWQDALNIYKTLEAQDGWPSQQRSFLIGKLIELNQKIFDGQQKRDSSIRNENHTLDQGPDLNIESEIRMLEDFYRQKQSEAKAGYIFGLAAGGTGFIIIAAGILGAFFLNIQIGVITSAAGVISEATATLLLRQNQRARKDMNDCQRDLVKMRNLSHALNITKTGISSQKEREKRINEIIRELIGNKQSRS